MAKTDVYNQVMAWAAAQTRVGELMFQDDEYFHSAFLTSIEAWVASIERLLRNLNPVSFEEFVALKTAFDLAAKQIKVEELLKATAPMEYLLILDEGFQEVSGVVFTPEERNAYALYRDVVIPAISRVLEKHQEELIRYARKERT